MTAPDTQELVRRLRGWARAEYAERDDPGLVKILCEAADALEAITLALQQEREPTEAIDRKRLEAENASLRLRLQAAEDVIKGADGDCDLNISAIGWLRSLIDTVREPSVMVAIHATSDDPDAINTMIRECETLERQGREYLRRAASWSKREDLGKEGSS